MMSVADLRLSFPREKNYNLQIIEAPRRRPDRPKRVVRVHLITRYHHYYYYSGGFLIFRASEPFNNTLN